MTKPYDIPKALAWEACLSVKANGGSAGIDQESLGQFEDNLSNNLYKLWNRLCSGSYFPPPVKGVPIPKKSGGVRMLGVPTVADRVAQTVVKQLLEPAIDPLFHVNSYGYRPGRSAHDAIAMVRRRSWEYDWVVEFDIKSLFDKIDHKLLMRALRKHCQTPWVLLYVERWLKTPMQMPDGELVERTRGTPQGGVVSPLLANLFLHYAFDSWVDRHLRSVRFCRYADDGVMHCRSLVQAKFALNKVGERFRQCGLELQCDKSLADLSAMFNPILRGWHQYYGRFYESAMSAVWKHLNDYLARWLMRKYKWLARHKTRARQALGRLALKFPKVFWHWRLGCVPKAG